MIFLALKLGPTQHPNHSFCRDLVRNASLSVLQLGSGGASSRKGSTRVDEGVPPRPQPSRPDQCSVPNPLWHDWKVGGASWREAVEQAGLLVVAS